MSSNVRTIAGKDESGKMHVVNILTNETTAEAYLRIDTDPENPIIFELSEYTQLGIRADLIMLDTARKAKQARTEAEKDGVPIAPPLPVDSDALEDKAEKV